MSSADYFVTTEWLAAHLGEPDLAIIDGTFFMPDEGRDAKAEYRACHIPGTVFFDIDAIADHSTNLPHMLPSPGQFADAMRKLGINERMHIVVYDASGLFSAPRVWWTLRTFGAKDVKILAGGLPKWKEEGRKLESGEVKRPPQTFAVAFDSFRVSSAADVLAASQSGSAQIVDARGALRFLGRVAEPRPGVRSGHIPGSTNVPYRDVIENGATRAPDEIVDIFTRAGVDLDKPIVTSCGSGVTAAILLLALETAGKKDARLYDGSWSEWGGCKDLPIETG
ncbi:MAG: 3-mercaptopyruvate sulfurtransferase [Methylovirgula sp.]|jgi:thiosulfate/3-mercaptopyruvate sulfurtransferase